MSQQTMQTSVHSPGCRTSVMYHRQPAAVRALSTTRMMPTALRPASPLCGQAGGMDEWKVCKQAAAAMCKQGPARRHHNSVMNPRQFRKPPRYSCPCTLNCMYGLSGMGLSVSLTHVAGRYSMRYTVAMRMYMDARASVPTFGQRYGRSIVWIAW